MRELSQTCGPAFSPRTLHDAYRSTMRRAPCQPLDPLPHTLSAN